MTVRVPKDSLRNQLVAAADDKIQQARERELIDACADHWRHDAQFWQREATMSTIARLRRWWAGVRA